MNIKFIIVLFLLACLVPIAVSQEKTANIPMEYADNACAKASVNEMYLATQASTLDEQQMHINNVKLYGELSTMGGAC